MTPKGQACKKGLMAVFALEQQCSYDDQVTLLKQNVREIIDYDKSFNNAETCHEFIRSVRYERIFLIVTPELIRDIFQQNIHEIRHVQAIFLFDPNETFWCIEYFQRLSYKVSVNALK